MKECAAANVRNFTLAGHAGSGKTSLAELMLFKAGVLTRLGSVDQGTSVSDFRPEEHERKSSMFSAVLNCPWNEHHFYFTDTPGYADFLGEAMSAMNVADFALIVVDAALGIGPGTIRAWKQARDRNIPRAFFINGCDREQADYEGVLNAIRENYGATVCIPFSVPVGAKSALSAVADVFDEGVGGDVAAVTEEYRMALTETVAETDETLMEKYFEDGELSAEELSAGLHKAILSGEIVPVFAGSVAKDIGVAELMNGLARFAPTPLAAGPVPLEGAGFERTGSEPVALVFKSVNDPFIGQLTFLRIYSGVFKVDGDFTNTTRGAKERFGGLLTVNGKEQHGVDEAGAGEIVAVPKLKNTHLGDVLVGKQMKLTSLPVNYPQPTMSYAVFAVAKGDEDKIGTGLQRLSAEDPTFKVERIQETHETVISGMGDQHLNLMVSRLKSEFKVDVRLETPRVPYRETITSVGSAQYRHKKQTGGHGQFAEVHLRLEPLPDEEFEFANEVVGGNIPKNYIPAVEKGVVETMVEGPLSYSKVINVKAVVFDGKYHPVDSSEMAFKIASRGAFRAAMTNAKPMLLEPIMSVRIMFPDEYMGDITGDLNSRRGRILGMDVEEGMQVVKAEVPMAELFTYATQLRSITQGKGSFEMIFERYEAVPAQIAQQIQEAAQREAEEED